MLGKEFWTIAIFILSSSSILGKLHKYRSKKVEPINRVAEITTTNSIWSLSNFTERKVESEVTKDREECIGCISGVYLVQYYIMKNETTPEIIKILNKICVALDYGNPDFCKDYSNQMGEIVVTILKNTTNTPREVCSFVYNLACGNGDVTGHRWNLSIPAGKPPVLPRPIPKANTPKLKVLHITDTHYDPLYKEGARDDCKARLCCRAENGMALKNESAAGKYGGWKCDIPEITFDSFLDHTSSKHGPFDYILWTGDIPSHASWTQTRKESIYMLKSTVGKILKHFPSTPIFPALGNHEGSPPNLYPSPALNRPDLISWLYEELARQWKLMLPESTIQTIRYGAFYVVQARPGLKIISINTNYCYFSNWWLILNSTDPGDMLSWMSDELLKAEAEGIKVHIIGHVPPGYIDCLKIWGNNFYKIISRFENTVTALFFGHTHADEIEIYYDSETQKRAVSVGYVGPSVTTFVNLNPGYRIYTIDGNHKDSSYDVVDYEGWIMDLEKSNQNRKPFWKKLYSAKDAYRLPSLQPDDWNKFYESLKTDDDLLDIYDRHYWKNSPRRPKCGNECRRQHLFDMRSGVHYGPPVIN